MKAKFLVYGILLVNLISIAALTRASDYILEIKEEEEIVYEIKGVNEEMLEDLFGKDWEKNPFFEEERGTVGAKSKIYLTEIEEDPKNWWKITYDQWEYTTEEFEDKADSKDKVENLAMDPKDMPKINISTYNQILILPKPTEEYLSKLEWAEDWSSEELAVIYEFETEEKADVRLVLQWDGTRGNLISMRFLNEDGEVAWESAIVGSISGTPMLIFLMIFAISAIGLIFLQKKICQGLKTA